MSSKAVLGIYKTREDAENAVNVLKNDGFSTDDISVLMPNSEGSQDFAHTKGTKAPEGATTGATSGAAIGGTLGLLAGLGVLAIPGIGPFIAAGPIMGALAGAGAGGAVGGIGGALIGLGVPEYEAKRYEGIVKDGGILLSVHAANSSEVDKAKKCLKKTDAKDISSTEETKGDRKAAPSQTSSTTGHDTSAHSVSSSARTPGSKDGYSTPNSTSTNTGSPRLY
jgi:hypothetical protein